MMPDGSPPPLSREIEAAVREAERRRVELARRIAELRANLSRTAALAGPALKAPSVAMKAGRSLVGAARARPLATGLAAGAVAIALGVWASRRQARSGELDTPVSALAGTEVDDVLRWADDGGPTTEDAAAVLEDHYRTDRDVLDRALVEALDTLDEAVREGLATAEEVTRDRAALIASHGERVAAAAQSAALGVSEGVAGAADAVAARTQAATSHVRSSITASPLTAIALLALAGAAASFLLPAKPATADEDKS
jgi:ElaB/YqjD/DUF883 family membrane-anchored ribosome-binding protein